MREETFTCKDCAQIKPVQHEGGTGYANDEQGDKICYVCCGKVDEKYMRENGKNTMYLTGDSGNYFVSNWPGTLKIPCYYSRMSRTNWGHKRVDVWFEFAGAVWWGRHQGDFNQIVRVKRTRHRVE